MPTPVALGEVLEVKIYNWMATVNQLAVNVRHYVMTDNSGSPTTADIALDVNNNVATPYVNLINENAEYYGVGVRNLSQVGSAPDYNNAGAAGGAPTGDAMPTGVCGIITLRTAMSGRANRGRVYVPFASELHNQGLGVPTVAYRDLLESLALVLAAPIDGEDSMANNYTITPYIKHAGGALGEPIIGYTVRGKWGYQRRRSAYGRINTLPF